MSFKSLFLPVGLLLAIVFGLLYSPAGIGAAGLGSPAFGFQQALIVIVFLITGYKIKWSEFKVGGLFAKVLTAALVINLLFGPVAAVAIAKIIGALEGFFIGLIVMSSVPTTLSSCVIIVRTVHGNTAWALMLMIALTLVGVLVLPFTLAAALGVAADIQVPIGALLLQIVLLLILPMAAGMALRRAGISRDHVLLDYTPPTAIILIVWMAVSKSAETLWGIAPLNVLLFAVAGAGVHGFLLLISWITAKFFCLKPADAVALIVVASQKTLPIAITVLIALPEGVVGGGILGVATVVCVVFHFSQIVFDSFLVQGWRKAIDAQA